MADLVDSRNSMEQEETSSLVAVDESNPTEWTEEKHYSFLKAMESTFVDQLHKQMSNDGAGSSQLKVLRDGQYWSTVDMKRDHKHVQEEESKLVPVRNPWIKHYRSSNVHPIRKLPSYPSKAPLATTQNRTRTRNFQLWRQDSICSSAEATDQNFNDGALEEGNSCSLHDTKRMRTTTTDDVVSSNDQVVPSDNIVRVRPKSMMLLKSEAPN